MASFRAEEAVPFFLFFPGIVQQLANAKWTVLKNNYKWICIKIIYNANGGKGVIESR